MGSNPTVTARSKAPTPLEKTGKSGPSSFVDWLPSDAAGIRSPRPNAPLADWHALEHDDAGIRAHTSRAVPRFDDYESRIQKGRTFFLSNAPRDDRRFDMVDGKARFTANALEYPVIPLGRHLRATLEPKALAVPILGLSFSAAGRGC